MAMERLAKKRMLGRTSPDPRHSDIPLEIILAQPGKFFPLRFFLDIGFTTGSQQSILSPSP